MLRIISSPSTGIKSANPALLSGWRLALAMLAAAGVIGCSSGIKIALHVNQFILPEMGALAYGVFTRPGGAWARAPLHVTLIPGVVAVIGTLVARHIPYGYWSVLLTVSGGISVLRLCRSPIAPAISCGLLPVIFGITDWWYPVNVVTTTVMLAIAASLWQRLPCIASRSFLKVESLESQQQSEEKREPNILGIVACGVFLVLAVTLVKITGLRMLLAPPIGVLAVEMFRYPWTAPWAKRPLWLPPIACFLSASIGLAAFNFLPMGPLVGATGIVGTGLILWMLKIYLPPAVAVSMLPLVMIDSPPTLYFPLWIAFGVGFFCLCIAAYRRVIDIFFPSRPEDLVEKT